MSIFPPNVLANSTTASDIMHAASFLVNPRFPVPIAGKATDLCCLAAAVCKHSNTELKRNCKINGEKDAIRFVSPMRLLNTLECIMITTPDFLFPSKWSITYQLIMYLMCCFFSIINAKCMIHLSTPQVVGFCDDDMFSPRSIFYFILHFLTSFLQQSFRDLTDFQVSFQWCCVYNDIGLKGYKRCLEIKNYARTKLWILGTLYLHKS